jgi:hypothetical protein
MAGTAALPELRVARGLGGRALSEVAAPAIPLKIST